MPSEDDVCGEFSDDSLYEGIQRVSTRTAGKHGREDAC
jgi:hypothetical protein